jgi:hypothetical protein
MFVRVSRGTSRRIVQDRLAASQHALRRVRMDAIHQVDKTYLRFYITYNV